MDMETRIERRGAPLGPLARWCSPPPSVNGGAARLLGPCVLPQYVGVLPMHLYYSLLVVTPTTLHDRTP